MPVRPLLAALLAALLACGPSPQSSSGESQVEAGTQAIVNGRETEAYPGVGYILTSTGLLCTASLVLPNMILYAAHCGPAQEFYSPWNGGTHRFATAFAQHPSFRMVGEDPFTSYDLAVSHLTEPIWHIPALRISNRAPILNEHIVLVGYGCSNYDGTGSFIKRYGLNRIGVIGRDFPGGDSDALLQLGFGWKEPDQGNICPGDSGGPTLIEEEPLVQTILGVHSMNFTGSINGGFDARTDPYVETRGWLEGRLQAAFEQLPPRAGACGTLPGNKLLLRETVRACNGAARLVHQGDGNVALYRTADNRPLWASGTFGKASGELLLQGDGNLVLYSAARSYLWASGVNSPGARVVLQDDCNLVTYNTANQPIWSTNTRCDCVFGPGRVLGRGETWGSCNGRTRLVHQTDGNVVLYQGSTPLWSTGTAGRATSHLVMQGDGNLVLYGADGRALWSPQTHGNPGANLDLQNDCNAVIYSADRRPLWSTGTRCR